MKCLNCGKENLEENKFCIGCGSPLNKIENPMSMVNDGNTTNNVDSPKPKNKKKIVIIVGIVIIILIISIIAYILLNKKEYNGKQSSMEMLTLSGPTGKILPQFIDGKYSDKLVKNENDALESLKDIEDKTWLNNYELSDIFKFVSKEVVNDITFYKFKQVYQDIPFLYHSITVSVDKNYHVSSFGGWYYNHKVHVETTPKKTESEIETIAKNVLGKNANIESSELYIEEDSDHNLSLVYVVKGYSDDKALEIIINANTGEVVSESDLIDNISSTYTGFGIDGITHTITLDEDKELLTGKRIYKFYDPDRYIYVTDYRGKGEILSTLLSGAGKIIKPIPFQGYIDGDIYLHDEVDSTFFKNAVTTMSNFELIYDYYKNVLGRNSFDNKGGDVVVNLGVVKSTKTGEDLNNAFWSFLTDQMYIGDYKGKSFSVSLDVLAHEFTHGVIGSVVNLATSPVEGKEDEAFETGSLSEGYADVLGSLIEGKNWTIAENNEVLRNLADPESMNRPSEVRGDYYYPNDYDEEERIAMASPKEYKNVQSYDGGGKHHNATIVGYAAYLMYESGAFKSREEMAKVWYNSLFYLNQNAGFEDCAQAVLKAAKELGLGESSITKITKAFIETNMLSVLADIEGVVTSADTGRPLSGVKVVLYNYETGEIVKSVRTDKNGKFSLTTINSDVYKIKFLKAGFDEYEKVLLLKDDIEMNVKLGPKNKKQTGYTPCKTNCVTLTIEQLAPNNNGSLGKEKITFKVEKGSILGVQTFVEEINKEIGTDMIKWDGSNIYLNMYGQEIEVGGWYYKGTDEKFDFMKPIYEDATIEMKLFGSLGNDDLMDLVKGLTNYNN